ncbi:MAG: DsrE family protein [Hyphomicrobiaceae bacterium]|nr:DsrE family protein [Hyphomicrobiaceae bacterium]
MRLLRLVAFACLAILVTALPARAAERGALFVNLTSDDAHRARMALVFSQKQQERGHSITIFLNDRAVRVGDRTKRKFKEHQSYIAAILKKGGTVLICPMCMKHYRVGRAALVDGLKVGSPELTGAALFAAGTKTLTW